MSADLQIVIAAAIVVAVAATVLISRRAARRRPEGPADQSGAPDSGGAVYAHLDRIPGIAFRLVTTADGNEAFHWKAAGADSLLGLQADQQTTPLDGVLERVHPQDRDAFRRSLLEARETDDSWTWSGRVLLPDGASQLIHISALPARAAGETARDGIMMAGRRRNSTAVPDRSDETTASPPIGPGHEPYRFYRRVEQSSGLGFWEWAVQTDELYLSPGWFRILGYESGELRHDIEQYVELIHPDDRPKVQDHISAHLQSNEPYDLECRMRRKNGDFVWIQTRAEAQWDEGGEPICMTGVITDVTERKQMEDSLRESETRFRDLVVRLDAGLVIQGPDDRILFANPAATKILGLTQVRMTGSSASDMDWKLIYENGDPVPRDQYPARQVLMSGVEVRGMPVGIVSPKDNEPTWLIMNAYARRDESGEIHRVATTFIDITERKFAEEQLARYKDRLEDLVAERTKELRRARDEAERATAAKSQFLSRMRHELRTPLNAILGFGQLLETDHQRPPSEWQLEQLREIRHAGTHLLAMIDQLVALSESEKGMLELQIEPVEIETELQTCLTKVRPLTEARGIRLEADAIESAEVEADRDRLQQVLQILLVSAIKHSKEGSVVRIGSTSIDQARQRIEIQGTGDDIADEALALLMKPSPSMASDSTDGEAAADAIGLVLAKRLIEAMNSQLHSETVPGGGTLFRIEMPLA